MEFEASVPFQAFKVHIAQQKRAQAAIKIIVFFRLTRSMNADLKDLISARFSSPWSQAFSQLKAK